MRIALTGGIACGKSLVAKFLNELGVETIDADDIVHELIPDPAERKRLAAEVFADPAKRKALEARADVYVDRVAFMPNIGNSAVSMIAFLSGPAKAPSTLRVALDGKRLDFPVKPGEMLVSQSLKIEKPRLWSLDDPYLYDVTLTLAGDMVLSMKTYTNDLSKTDVIIKTVEVTTYAG